MASRLFFQNSARLPLACAYCSGWKTAVFAGWRHKQGGTKKNVARVGECACVGGMHRESYDPKQKLLLHTACLAEISTVRHQKLDRTPCRKSYDQPQKKSSTVPRLAESSTIGPQNSTSLLAESPHDLASNKSKQHPTIQKEQQQQRPERIGGSTVMPQISGRDAMMLPPAPFQLDLNSHLDAQI